METVTSAAKVKLRLDIAMTNITSRHVYNVITFAIKVKVLLDLEVTVTLCADCLGSANLP
jgi:hypothetical protein